MFNRIKEYIEFRRLREIYSRYERLLIPGALLLGFLADIIFFAFIDFDFAIIALSIHLAVAALSIAFINFYEDGVLRGRFFNYLRFIAPSILQFTFGALFSAFVIFYSFSGSVFASWPFILVLVFLMIANEIFRKYNHRPDIHIAVFFFALFSFLNLAIPYLTRSLGTLIFILSGILSLVIIGLFIWGLSTYLRNIRIIKGRIYALIAGIFISMNIFYFTNLIPPIPLTIQEVGIYNHIERVGDDYKLTSREETFFEKIRPGNRFYVNKDIGEAYGFSSVSAPPGMELEIIHEWQFVFNDLGWVTKSITSFPITGGREGGFRAFSKTSQIEPGKWRLNIRTKNGQIIGRYNFKVVKTDDLPPLITEIK